jgi:hypothetical protein
MAIKVLNSQGTKIYVLPESTDMSDCDKIAAALTSAKLVGCPQSLGNIEETRNEKEIKCLSSNESVKSFGAISRGSLEIGMLYDPDDAEGQAELTKAFKDNKLVWIVIELPNKPATAGSKHGTLKAFKAGVSGVSTTIEMDSEIGYNVTLSISSSVTECPAA